MRVLQHVRLPQIDQRLDDVALALSHEVERAQAARIDDLNVRVGGSYFVNQNAAARRKQYAQRGERGAAR